MARESAAVLLALAMVCGSVPAAQGEASSTAAPSKQEGKSADEIAKELSKGVGAAGTLPTATDSDVAGEQWRLGPELFGGVIREWGLVGALVSNQWDVGGWDDESYSVMTAQYFYAYGLGNGWQIASSPIVTYDWKADSDQALSLPLGFGVAKTTKLGGKPWKFAAQVQYFVEQPDAFGPDWLLKFTFTPVVQNKLADLFK